MSRPPEPLFLARQSYRHRRFGDAARFLPLLGLILLLYLYPLLGAPCRPVKGLLVPCLFLFVHVAQECSLSMFLISSLRFCLCFSFFFELPGMCRVLRTTAEERELAQ